MNTCALIRTIGARLRRFGRAERGNTTIIFALACIPLFGLVGAAVDYSRASTIRSAMQAAVDTIALAIGKSIGNSSTTPTAADIQSQANTYFNAVFTRKDANNPTVTATYSATNGNQVLITANATMNTDFMGVMKVFGCSSICTTIPLQASSTTTWGNALLRVALVLDNTGSMAQSGKLSALKTALVGTTGTGGLLGQLKQAATNPGDVYVSIIPFVKDVSVSSATNYTASWIDWTDWLAEPLKLDLNTGGSKPSNWFTTGAGSSCPFSTSGQGFRCTNGPATSGASTTSWIPSSGNYNGLVCPGLDGGNKVSAQNGVYYNGCYNSWTKCVGSACTCTNTNTSQCSCTGSGSSKTCTAQKISGTQYYDHTWRPTTTNATYTPTLALDIYGNPYATPTLSTWNGCLTDRGSWSGPDTTNNYDTNTSTPVTGNPTSLFPAQQYSSCPLNVMPLSYDWSTMSSYIQSMVAAGSTNQNIGLVHGWQSLVGGGPYPAPPPMTTGNTYKQIIILLTDGLNTQDRWYGNGSSTSTQVDDRQKLTCKAINDAGITLYTVQVDTDGSPTSTLLQGCAGSPGKYPDSSKFFLLTSSNQIITTFQQIGTQLSQLRVSK